MLQDDSGYEGANQVNLCQMRRVLRRRDVDSIDFRFSSQQIEKQQKYRLHSQNFGLVLFSALSHDPIGSFGWNLGVQKTRYLERVTLGTLKNRVPDLMPYVRHCGGVLEADTRFLHLLD